MSVQIPGGCRMFAQSHAVFIRERRLRLRQVGLLGKEACTARHFMSVGLLGKNRRVPLAEPNR
eukprot:5739114-Heterocapsa_arctica.AAC.1